MNIVYGHIDFDLQISYFLFETKFHQVEEMEK